jgi:hypothetical protein
VDWSQSQFFKKGTKKPDQTGPDLKALAVAAMVAVEVVAMDLSSELQGDNPSELNTDSFPSPVTAAFCPLGLPINLSMHTTSRWPTRLQYTHRSQLWLPLDKFMGKPKGQKATATGEGNESVLSSPGLSPCSSNDEAITTTSTATVAATATTTTLAQLVEQQKVLAD